MTIKTFIQELGDYLPLSQAENFDNVGLLCGNFDREITGILVCHDALEIVVQEAIDKGANLVFCFHPIIFSGLKSLTGKNYVERAVLKAIENKIAILAVHTAWDNHYFGVNYGMCKALELKNHRVLMPKKQNLSHLITYVPADYAESVREALFAQGAGRLGFYEECSFNVLGQGTFKALQGANPFSGILNVRELSEEIQISVVFESYKTNRILAAMRAAHPYEEVAYQLYNLENDNQYAGLGSIGDLSVAMDEIDFLNFVKQKFGLQVIRHSPFTNRKIKTIGMLGGSGTEGIKYALLKGCDAYLTGDIKYHEFFQSENQMLICDIGHYESERFVVQQLFELLSEKFTKFAILKSEAKTNPVNYFL